MPKSNVGIFLVYLLLIKFISGDLFFGEGNFRFNNFTFPQLLLEGNKKVRRLIKTHR